MSTTRAKPWVFILGGTGETISTSMDEERGQINHLIQMRDRLQNKIKYNQGLLDKTKNEEGLRHSLHLKSGNPNRNLLNNQLNEDKRTLSSVEDLLSLATSSSYHLFDPNNPNIPQENIHYVKGVQAPDLNKLYKIDKSFDYITAASQHRRIQECMVKLRKARDKNPSELPDRIILNGHSRGASACIELARAIYLEFGDGPPKIAMNIIDPVPGPGRHHHKRMVIPPNVDSAIIHYAGNESSSLFKLQEVYFDSKYTTVTTKVYPINHGLFEASVDNNRILPKEQMKIAREQAAIEIKNEIQLNNRQMLTALTNPKGEIIHSPTLADNTIKGKGSREKMTLSVATDPDTNINLPASLKNLHNNLQHTIAKPVTKELESFFTQKNNPDLALIKKLSNKNRMGAKTVPTVNMNKASRRKLKKMMKRNLKIIRIASKQERKKIKSIQGFLQSAQNWLSNGMTGKGTTDPKKEITNHFLKMVKKNNLNIDVDCVGHGNNVVLKLTDKSSKETRILIASLFDEGNEDTINKVVNSRFAAKTYYSKLVPSNVPSTHAKITIVENVPHSLISKANNSKNDEEKIKNAINIGKQISEFLGFLTTNNLVWKDLKPQNVLVREDNSIAISDMKAFRQNNNHDSLCDVTKQYLPIGMNKLINSSKPPDQSTWESIYSYQLAVILYHQATNVLVENIYHFDEVEKDNTHLLHNCDDEVFSSEEGQRLKFIIQSLANPDPKYQLKHHEAAELLSVLTDENQYKMRLEKINKNNPILTIKSDTPKNYTFNELLSKLEEFQLLLKEKNHGIIPDKFSKLSNYIETIKNNEKSLDQIKINYYTNKLNDKIDQLKNLEIKSQESVSKSTPSLNH